MKSTKTLLTIACRVGSKGVPRKCERMVAGKPLAQWTIEQAREYKEIESLRNHHVDIMVSTDSELIIGLARDILNSYYWWCDRPMELWSDGCGKPEVLNHILMVATSASGKYDTLTDLDICNPLRSYRDIERCNYYVGYFSRIISVAEAPVNPIFNSYLMIKHGPKTGMNPLFGGFKRRQDAKKVYVRNNSIFVYKPEWFEKMDEREPWRGYLMPPETGGVDVDHEHNLRWLECEMKHAGF